MRLSLNQIAVYWAPLPADSFGQVTADTPIEISCRWEDKNEIFTNAAGNEEVSKSIIYPAVAIKLDGWVSLMPIADLASDDSPLANNAVQIKAVYDCPAVRGTTVVRKAWLG